MYRGKSVGLILLMAGSGQRFDLSLPKQFALLKETPLYQHTLRVFSRLNAIDETLLVCHPDFMDRVRAQEPQALVVSGGRTRQESVYLGLKECKGVDIVIVHDAVRPFVSPSIILQNMDAAIDHGAANTCIPSADTIVHAPQGKIAFIPKRSEYLRGQTPQTFRLPLLLEAHEEAQKEGIENASDDCQLVLRLGHPVFIVPGDESNFKITTKLDLLISNSYIDNIINYN